MNRRGIPALVILLAGFAALIVVGRDQVAPVEPFFASPAGAWMPSVNDNTALTGSWFCPGVPATGEDGVGGAVVVANRSDEQLLGRYTILTSEGVAASETLTVEPWSRSTIDVDAFVTAPFASVVVELDGGRGFVEQRAQHPAGDSVAPCADNASDEWYFADGFTADGSLETLLLTNPYDDAAVVDLVFATSAGEFTPAEFQGFTILPQSIQTIPIAELGLRDETVIAVKASAQRGRLVVGRAQHYLGGGRLGYGVTLGAPALREQWWFADGATGDGISETFAVYNPTEDDVEVDAIFLGVPLDAIAADPIAIDVPARSVVVYDPSEDEALALPDGRHSAVFSTLSEPSVVVERILTRPAGDQVATSVVLGAPPRVDGYVASRWHIGIGPSDPTSEALVVYNVDNADGTITIEAVGPGGPTAVPSLTDIPIGPGQVISIDLVDPDVLDRELIVQASTRVFVERSLARGDGLSGASGSWALPAAGG